MYQSRSPTILGLDQHPTGEYTNHVSHRRRSRTSFLFRRWRLGFITTITIRLNTKQNSKNEDEGGREGWGKHTLLLTLIGRLLLPLIGLNLRKEYRGLDLSCFGDEDYEGFKMA